MALDTAALGHGVLIALKWLGIAVGSLVALLVLGLLIVPPVTRHWTDRWGATEDELTMSLPGDELAEDPDAVSTRAVSIDAPADVVYSLVTQMGYKRGGWYGRDWFYNSTGSADFVTGKYHADRIVPELQDLGVGDRMEINSMMGYEVVQADRPDALIMVAAFDAQGAPCELDDESADGYQTWQWVVRETGPDSCRLYLRTQSRVSQPNAFVAWLYDKPFDFGGACMAHWTLTGIRDTAERIASEG